MSKLNFEASAPFEPDAAKLGRNYEKPLPRELRWEYYFLNPHNVIIEDKVIDLLHDLEILPVSEGPVVEIGPAAGDLLADLVFRELASYAIGIDPNDRQFKKPDEYRLKRDAYDMMPEEIITYLQKSQSNGNFMEINKEGLEVQLKQLQTDFLSKRMQLIKGSGEDLKQYVKDGSVKLLFALFVLYHFTTEQRQTAYSEFSRVLAKDGMGIIATSGNEFDGTGNKDKLRDLEKFVAEFYGIDPPQPMNAGYTAKQARAELTEAFRYVYVFEHSGEVVIENEEQLDIYFNSLRSLANQFEPELAEDKLNEIIEGALKPMVLNEVDTKGCYTDSVRRDIYVFSNQAINEEVLLMHGFKRVLAEERQPETLDSAELLGHFGEFLDG